MLKNALSVLPTRPVVYIVPLVVVLVMSFYYWNIYIDCTKDKQRRASFNKFLHSINSSEPFRLTDVTDFSWDKVRIIDNYKPERKIAHCPFGWDWSAAERKSLIASNILSILIFAYNGVIVEHLELRSDEIIFKNIDNSLMPDTAIFSFIENEPGTSGITLTLIE